MPVLHAKPGVSTSKLDTGFGDFLCMLAQMHCVSWFHIDVVRHTNIYVHVALSSLWSPAGLHQKSDGGGLGTCSYAMHVALL